MSVACFNVGFEEKKEKVKKTWFLFLFIFFGMFSGDTDNENKCWVILYDLFRTYTYLGF